MGDISLIYMYLMIRNKDELLLVIQGIRFVGVQFKLLLKSVCVWVCTKCSHHDIDDEERSLTLVGNRVFKAGKIHKDQFPSTTKTLSRMSPRR